MLTKQLVVHTLIQYVYMDTNRLACVFLGFSWKQTFINLHCPSSVSSTVMFGSNVLVTFSISPLEHV